MGAGFNLATQNILRHQGPTGPFWLYQTVISHKISGLVMFVDVAVNLAQRVPRFYEMNSRPRTVSARRYYQLIWHFALPFPTDRSREPGLLPAPEW